MEYVEGDTAARLFARSASAGKKLPIAIGIRIMLDKPEKVEAGTSIIYFKVPNINEAHEQMKARGVEFVDKPHLIAKLPDHDLWMTFFRDSEGNLLGMMSEVRPPKP